MYVSVDERRVKLLPRRRQVRLRRTQRRRMLKNRLMITLRRRNTGRQNGTRRWTLCWARTSTTLLVVRPSYRRSLYVLRSDRPSVLLSIPCVIVSTRKFRFAVNLCSLWYIKPAVQLLGQKNQRLRSLDYVKLRRSSWRTESRSRLKWVKVFAMAHLAASAVWGKKKRSGVRTRMHRGVPYHETFARRR